MNDIAHPSDIGIHAAMAQDSRRGWAYTVAHHYHKISAFLLDFELGGIHLTKLVEHSEVTSNQQWDTLTSLLDHPELDTTPLLDGPAAQFVTPADTQVLTSTISHLSIPRWRDATGTWHLTEHPTDARWRDESGPDPESETIQSTVAILDNTELGYHVHLQGHINGGNPSEQPVVGRLVGLQEIAQSGDRRQFILSINGHEHIFVRSNNTPITITLPPDIDDDIARLQDIVNSKDQS